MFACPFCGERFQTFMGLRSHVILQHYRNEQTCPVCGERYRSLKVHAYNMAKKGDREHAIYFGLISRASRSRVGLEGRELAYCECEVVA